jgi:hypothetical protein
MPLARRDNILEQDLGREVLLYDLSSNKAFNLNETVAAVYMLSDGRTTVGEISDRLSVKFRELVPEEMVLVALDELRQNGLLENASGNFFGGTSRREMIRRAGLASMVALPLVSGLVAPKAAHAQSSCTGEVCAGAAGGCCLPDVETCCSGFTCCDFADICCGTECCTGGAECCDGFCCSLGDECCNGTCTPMGTCCGGEPCTEECCNDVCVPIGQCCGGSFCADECCLDVCCAPGETCDGSSCVPA